MVHPGVLGTGRSSRSFVSRGTIDGKRLWLSSRRWRSLPGDSGQEWQCAARGPAYTQQNRPR